MNCGRASEGETISSERQRPVDRGCRAAQSSCYAWSVDRAACGGLLCLFGTFSCPDFHGDLTRFAEKFEDLGSLAAGPERRAFALQLGTLRVRLRSISVQAEHLSRVSCMGHEYS